MHKYLNHEITNIEAAKLIGVSRGTFFRLSKSRKMAEYQLLVINEGLAN